MMKPPQFTEWMPIKYGEPKKPFKLTVTYENIVSGDNGQWKDESKEGAISYDYSLTNT